MALGPRVVEQDAKQHFSREDLRDLFTLSSGTASDTHDLLGCDCCADETTATKEDKPKSRQTLLTGAKASTDSIHCHLWCEMSAV